MITYLLAAFGLAYIVGHSTISLPVRKWMGGIPERQINGVTFTPIPGALGRFGDFITALIECPACFGFWTGLAMGFAHLVTVPADLLPTGWPLTLACVTAGSNFILGRLTRLI